jgi:hypothetical protein
MKRDMALDAIDTYRHKAQEFICRIEGMRGGWYEGKIESVAMVKAVNACDDAKRAFQQAHDKAHYSSLGDVPDDLVELARQHYDGLKSAYEWLKKGHQDPDPISE